MQLLRTSTTCFAAVALAASMGCTSKKHPTDHTIRVTVNASAKPAVVEVLDRLTAAHGWTKTKASGDLSDLTKRPIVFFSYGRNPKDMLITITDIKKDTELEVSAFFEDALPGVVEGVAKAFAIEVRSVPGVSQVEEERRAKQ